MVLTSCAEIVVPLADFRSPNSFTHNRIITSLLNLGYGKTLLIRSGDRGETWTEPAIINNTPLDDRDAGIIELASGHAGDELVHQRDLGTRVCSRWPRRTRRG